MQARCDYVDSLVFATFATCNYIETCKECHLNNECWLDLHYHEWRINGECCSTHYYEWRMIYSEGE